MVNLILHVEAAIWRNEEIIMFQDKMARKIPPNRLSVTGFFKSRRGELLWYESKIERDTYFLLDLEPRVTKISAQPFKIDDYTPDCQIEVDGLQKHVREIKFEERLIKEWNGSLEKYQAANRSCMENNSTFGFFTDYFAYYDPYRLSILRRIKSSARYEDDADGEALNFARKILEDAQKLTMGSLIEKCNTDPKQGMLSVCKLVMVGDAYVSVTPTDERLDAVLIPAARACNPLEKSFTLEKMLSRLQSHPDWPSGD